VNALWETNGIVHVDGRTRCQTIISSALRQVHRWHRPIGKKFLIGENDTCLITRLTGLRSMSTR
jgi:hypothetical protein